VGLHGPHRPLTDEQAPCVLGDGLQASRRPTTCRRRSFEPGMPMPACLW
jgi:hypothetical protein